jgi:hypothetical protein
MRIAVGDDEQHVALSLADRSVGYADDRHRISDHLTDSNAVVALIGFSKSPDKGEREMLPGNSRFQRLSQSALSRSRFFRLAAGALLPFVGLRLSAAAVPNLEMAQNSGVPGTNYATTPGRKGAILVSQFGPVNIHSYLSHRRLSRQYPDDRGTNGGRHLRWSAPAAVC